MTGRSPHTAAGTPGDRVVPESIQGYSTAESGALALDFEPGDRALRRGAIPAWIFTEESTAWMPI